MQLSQAVEGFLLAKRIERLSPHALEGYECQIQRLAAFLDTPPVADVTTDDLHPCFDFLRNEYTPERLTGNSRPLSPRPIRSYWMLTVRIGEQADIKDAHPLDHLSFSASR